MVFQTCCAAAICLCFLRTANKFQNIGFLWWTAGDSHNWVQAMSMQETAVIIPMALPILAPTPPSRRLGWPPTKYCSQLKNTTLGLLCWARSNWNEGEVSQGYFPAENKVSQGKGKGKQHQNFTILFTWGSALLWYWADIRHAAKAELIVMVIGCRRQ